MDEFTIDDKTYHKLAQLSRKICDDLGVDPDHIVDDYGPVRKEDVVCCAIYSFIEKNRLRPVNDE